jgi:hypothetical protein
VTLLLMTPPMLCMHQVILCRDKDGGGHHTYIVSVSLNTCVCGTDILILLCIFWCMFGDGHETTALAAAQF